MAGSDGWDSRQDRNAPDEIFRLAFANAAVGLAFTDPSGRFVRVNQAFCALTGYAEHELYAQTYLAITHPDDRETNLALTRQALEGGRHHFVHQKRYVHKSGGTVWVQNSVTLVRNGAGELLNAVGLVEDISERKHAEAALAESETRYRRLVEDSPDAIVLHDGQHILYGNPAAARLFGTDDPAQLVGRPVLEAIDPEDHPQVVRRIRAILDAGLYTTAGISRLRHASGQVTAVEVTAGPCLYHGQRAVQAIFRDVTDRVRAEQVLLQRTQQMEAVRVVTGEITRELNLTHLLQLILRHSVGLVQGAGAAVFLWDAAAEILVPQAWEGFGEWFAALRVRKGEGIIGQVAIDRQGRLVNDYPRSPYALPVIVERAGVRHALVEPLLYRDRLLGTLVVYSVERPFGAEAQDTIRLLASQAAIAIENAQLHTRAVQRGDHLGTLNDLAQTLSRLREPRAVAESILPAVQRLLPDTGSQLWELDESGEVLGLVHSEGLPAPGAGTRTLRVGEGLAGSAVAARRPVTSADVRQDPRFANRAWAAEQHLVAGLGIPLLYDERPLGALVILTRTAHEFSAEEQRLFAAFAAQAAIALQNARLYADLKRSYDDLHDAQEELVRAEKLRGLGQMAAGIAHDLNNTLATILGQTELLRFQPLSAAVEEGMERLQTAANDGAQVVRRLQEFARQRSGGPLESCDLPHLVHEALAITRPRWREEPRRKGIEVEAEADITGLPSVRGNPAEIREVLTNLIFNAVDAMPSGGLLRFTGRVLEDPPRLSAGLAPAGAEGQWVELAVTDSGIGMPEHVRRRVFDPFFTTKGLHGTGLGLSVVYGIMERHGGGIAAESAPGQGSTFRLRFRPAPTPADASAPLRGPSAVPVRRLLLIDDDPLVRETLACVLRVSGQVVCEASGGREGLALLGTTPIDVVITDLGMPEVNGWDVAREAKARCPQTPVVLLTGWGEHVLAEAPTDVTVDHILGKPVSGAALLAIIQRVAGPPAS
jgi:PAS domain S-box-containing protein